MRHFYHTHFYLSLLKKKRKNKKDHTTKYDEHTATTTTTTTTMALNNFPFDPIPVPLEVRGVVDEKTSNGGGERERWSISGRE